MRRRRRADVILAFTMIELVVVMIILGILAALVVNSVGGVMDRHQLARAVETIERFDARARRDARTHRLPTEVVIDRTRGRLTVVSADRSDPTYRLPRQVKIKEIRMRRRKVVVGQVEVDINSFGQSPSYAMHLQRGESSRWLVVLGFSGQVITFDTKGEADAILAL